MDLYAERETNIMAQTQINGILLQAHIPFRAIKH